jgi:hypothetical protein
MYTAMNIQAAKNVGKCLSSLVAGGFSRRAQLHGLNFFVRLRIPTLHFFTGCTAPVGPGLFF